MRLPHQHRDLLCCRFLRSPLDNQLATSGANVAPAALPDRHGQLAIGQDLREPVDLFVRGPLIRDTWRSVEWNQVHLGFNARQQLYEPVRVPGGVVYSSEQHILKCDAAALLQRKAPACGENLLKRVLAVRRHQGGSRLISGGVQ